MNQNEKKINASRHLKNLNQLTIPNKSKESHPNYSNIRRRNSQNLNTYNFSINKPLSPLTSHSSFLIPSNTGKYGNNNNNSIKISQQYNSMESYNNTLDDSVSNSNSDLPILGQLYRKNPYNEKDKPHKNLPIPLQTQHNLPQSLRHSLQASQPEKKSSILLNNEYNSFYEDPSENTLKLQRYPVTSTHMAGWALLFTTYIVFIIGMYSVIFSKLMSDTGNPVLDSIKHDKYYCYLLPLLIVIIYLFIFINWLSMKFFRHN